LRSTTIVTRLTEHDDVTKSLLRGVPRPGLALGPHLPGPALVTNDADFDVRNHLQSINMSKPTKRATGNLMFKAM